MHILCIDDDPIYKDLYGSILEPAGHTVRVAMDLADGWSQATEQAPDVITLDIMMPESKGFLDGYALLKKIRESPKLQGIPVIMISALDDQTDIAQGKSEGATTYLPKQKLTPQRLLKAIAVATSKKI